MTCPVFPITAKKALDKVAGVEEAKMDYDQRTATVKFDPSKTDIGRLTKGTTDAGYPSTAHKH